MQLDVGFNSSGGMGRPLRTLIIAGIAAMTLLSPAVAAVPSREPTEAEMRQALMDRLNGSQDAVRKLKDECSHLNGNSSPILGMQCLTVMAPLPSISIKSFEKLNCGAATTGGYICDYLIAVDMGQLTAGLGGEPTTAQKRFIKSPTRGWIALDVQ